MNNNIFGKRLRMLRREKDIVMTDLADSLELTQATISKYENGKRIPNIEILKRIAQYFNVSTDYLLGKTDVRESYHKVTDHYINELSKDLEEEGYDIKGKSKDEIIKLMILALEMDKLYKKND